MTLWDFAVCKLWGRFGYECILLRDGALWSLRAWGWLWTLRECTIQEPPPLMHECTNLLPTWIPCASIIIIIIIIMLFWEVEEKGSSLLNSWVLTPLLSSASLVSVPARIQWFASFLGRRKKILRPPPPPPPH
jgi:hypothetical protein